MSDDEPAMPIFTKTYDWIAWIVPLTNHFPRVHRQTITRRLLDATLDFLEGIVAANNLRGRERLAQLGRAETNLDKVRFYIRLAHQWHWINPGQYKHASQMLAEIGRLLGGWLKATRQQLASAEAVRSG